MTRAETRHYFEREKAHIRRFVRQKWEHKELADDPKWVGRHVGHYPCSCYMCGNPRRHFGKRTMQEIRAELE